MSGEKGLAVQPPRTEPIGGMGTGTKILLGVLVLVLILLAAVILTLTVSTVNPEQGATQPYTTLYAVSFPEGEATSIGTTRIVVLSYQDEMVVDVDGDREKLVIGEERRLAERRARITVLGIPIIETNFQITLKYKGVRTNRAYFDLTLQTQKQVPEFILKRLLPASIDARAV